MNESAQDRQRSLLLGPGFGEEEWRNRLIWGEKKYVLSAVPRCRRYLDEMPGSALQDVWTDINAINLQAIEAPRKNRYWAVDWDNKGDTFHDEWQTYRTRKDKSLAFEITHSDPDPGEYAIVVKVIDILGNDTTKTVKVRVA